mmetsp:Transcript_107889/g.247303  ORF Transcript_107889/g.247303 Transcript_107889/m.247303 type:complete len:230 (+) Transcript_107889:45-734(+)|eukprot:CAMPEP_0204253602 /NCGR_PEP_ID=MMETSP0468-20130131/1972_1 /ASSEMBLY_ACC=CAM_ASM_000383 /TAXON_ID=2969 /ORGANISM="Oxyrrhis marina" /LENGTH=229 /DNA_ID=CAMNT_0051227195 /DNA_START=52 /DNA_END=741 /DNA_ORIENTATION=-
MASVKLIYFGIEGAAEKVRLALVLSGTAFDDKRITFPEWGELKPKAKCGQLPLMTVDGKEPMESMDSQISQSGAMMRWAGRQGDGSLYPQDIESMLKIEEVLGLVDDMSRAFMPCFYIAMRPQMFGHPEDMPDEEKKALTKKLREGFVAEKVPEFMKFLSRHLEASGGTFICGTKPTIADCALLPTLRNFTRGHIDFVPTTLFEPYPQITSYISRMMELPQIKEWYAKQ